ncbi:phosphoribosyltransferase (plasmid) [Halorussus salilacus]|uniref:phosphoribosyltransferase n=1 Tax=Halorussus salilacus TaxID=2953750 RepID=UPI0020A082BE|nr:phosphoribosyltransferase family protein [Halorussus salilacus]USZ69801.1 phosphoribosyltransferase [Halorussus salilacus]
MFQNRTDAGRQLGALLADGNVEADIVLGIPRGGLPVARAVADALDAPLDVVVASKIGAPSNPELAVGAVASDGTVWYNDDLLDRVGASEAYLDRERERETAVARGKLERYRGSDRPPDVEGKRVVVVDDGLATGATTIAALRQVRAAGAARVVLAVPVGSPDSVERLRAEADEVVAVETPPHFSAVGQFYRDFGQVSDEQAMSYLDR